jgi:CMP-2-keto-3-deoxyoctulosonic acid synthetase
MLRNGTPWFLKRSVDLLPAEQLRLQEIGTTINSLLVDISLESVNIASDLSKVKKKLKNDKEQKQILAKILNYEK